MKLYELSECYKRLTDDRMDTETGEIFDLDAKDFQARLDEIKDSLEDKAENIGKVYLQLTGESDMLDTELKRIQKRKSRLDNKAKWLKDYVLVEFITAEITEVKRPLVSLLVKTNPPSVDVTDENKVEQQWWRVIPETKVIDKKLILEKHKETGEDIEGINIIRNKRLDIK